MKTNQIQAGEPTQRCEKHNWQNAFPGQHDCPYCAPNLLEALRHCDRLAGCQGNAQDVSFAIGEIRSIALAAIAKAEAQP